MGCDDYESPKCDKEFDYKLKFILKENKVMANIKRCPLCHKIQPLRAFEKDKEICLSCLIKKNMTFEIAQKIIMGTYDGWIPYNEESLRIAKRFIIDNVDKLRWYIKEDE